MTESGSQPIFRTRNYKSMTNHSKFTVEEDDLIMKMVNEFNNSDQRIHWCAIANKLSNKSGSDVSHRWNTVLNPDLKKGSWTSDEDLAIINWVKQYGPVKWTLLQKNHLQCRCGKQIRERWVNILSPSVQIHGINVVENILKNDNKSQDDEDNINKIKKKYHINIEKRIREKSNKELISSSQPISNTKWTKEEDDLIIKLVKSNGPKWKLISSLIRGRSENSVKNRWHAIKTQRFRIEEGKEPLLKRGRKKKINKLNDRSLLMMKDNEEKFSEIEPNIIRDAKNDLNQNIFDELDMCNNEYINFHKDKSFFSPISISILPRLEDFKISFEMDPIPPPSNII